MFLSSSSLIPVNKNKSGNYFPPFLTQSHIFQVITHQPKPLAQLYHNLKPALQLQLFSSPPTSNLFSATTSQHILLTVLPSYLPQLTPHPSTTITFQTMKGYLPVIWKEKNWHRTLITRMHFCQNHKCNAKIL